MNAVKAYELENWEKCEELFKKSLNSLLKEINKCQLICEDYLDWSALSANSELSVVFTSKY